jgi:hypothetical protein
MSQKRGGRAKAKMAGQQTAADDNTLSAQDITLANQRNDHMPPELTQDELTERTWLMRRDSFIVAIAGLSLANGTHLSPFFDPAFLLFRNFAPAFFITSQVLVFYFTSLFLATFTLLVAGVPAAIYERVKGEKQGSITSMIIWLVCLIPLTLPSIMALVNG